MAYETNGWNGNGNGPILFTNVRVLDATGEYPFTGEVLVQGNRVKQVSRGSSRVGSSPMQGGATVIDTPTPICACEAIGSAKNSNSAGKIERT